MRERHILIHYHLRPGGVTTVLREQARVLSGLGEVVTILSGEAPPPGEDDFPASIEVLPALAYRDTPLDPDAFDCCLHEMAGLAGQRGVLHFHNPTLGKNPSWGAWVNRLATRGHALLLQIHDFGEDGRWPPGRPPDDHAGFYPMGNRIRWLVLNPNDRNVLLGAGMNEADVAIVPNPVAPPGYGALPPARDGKIHVLYPARGIRRKNIGEFLLLAALAPASWEFRSTLPPHGKAQERLFRRWEKWADKLGVTTWLGNGPGTVRPDVVISTSVREGFGYSFAEPWLAGVPATGRHPGRWLVGQDGVALPRPPGLYRAIRVPTLWLRPGVWRRALANAVEDVRNRDAIALRFEGDRIDFADLPESEQRHVLRRVVGNQRAASAEITFELMNDRLLDPPSWFTMAAAHSSAGVLAMAERVRLAFFPATVGGNLREIASSVRAARATLRGHADASMVSGAFSAPEDFRFLRLPPP